MLKTMMRTFEGDYEMFHRSRIEARRLILENKELTDEVEIQDKIFIGEEARELLRVNVMQGTVQPSGVVRLKARREHCLSS